MKLETTLKERENLNHLYQAFRNFNADPIDAYSDVFEYLLAEMRIEPLIRAMLDEVLEVDQDLK